jgi:hypothetical protein
VTNVKQDVAAINQPTEDVLGGFRPCHLDDIEGTGALGCLDSAGYWRDLPGQIFS